jgi:hypothetical protein
MRPKSVIRAGLFPAVCASALRLPADKLRKARAELAKGLGINKVAKMVGLGVGTVQKLKGEMVANS